MKGRLLLAIKRRGREGVGGGPDVSWTRLNRGSEDRSSYDRNTACEFSDPREQLVEVDHSVPSGLDAHLLGIHLTASLGMQPDLNTPADSLRCVNAG